MCRHKRNKAPMRYHRTGAFDLILSYFANGAALMALPRFCTSSNGRGASGTLRWSILQHECRIEPRRCGTSDKSALIRHFQASRSVQTEHASRHLDSLATLLHNGHYVNSTGPHARQRRENACGGQGKPPRGLKSILMAVACNTALSII
jgi:hypothetical protein